MTTVEEHCFKKRETEQKYINTKRGDQVCAPTPPPVPEIE